MMPEGTVFSYYTPCIFGDLSIKGKSLANDFYVQQITNAIKHNDSSEFVDLLNQAEKDGISLEMDFDYEGRDGMFNEDQLFAIWEKQDVEKLIQRLQQTL